LKPVEAPASAAEPSSTVSNDIPSAKPTGKTSSKPTQGRGKDEDVLRREIKALGGDEEDWEMLKDLSDSDEEPDSNVAAKSTKGKGRETPAEDVSTDQLEVLALNLFMPSSTEKVEERIVGIYERTRLRLCRPR
jgi:hypothetical protein